MLGVTLPVGALALLVSCILHKEEARDRDARYLSMGATYAWSKRTTFYGSRSTIRNGRSAAFGSGVAGVDGRWLNFGITHSF